VSELGVGIDEKLPAPTYSRAKGTTIGPEGLTAVFGMGTGVSPPVWSPGACLQRVREKEPLCYG
jgi:hypothetical protein